jgi:hypothetical protein
MRETSSTRWLSACAVVGWALTGAGCGDDAETGGEGGSGATPWEVTVTSEDFVAGVDNELLPLPVGATWRYESTTDEGLEVISVEVLAETKKVWGVTATVVRDTVTLNDELAEDTKDWFAQDKDGNVWYLGEETCEYDGGECVDTGGSWEAGVDGALPGIAMMASPKVGDAYYQEYYADEAEDYGEVVEVGASASVPAGDFTDCVKTRDTTKLDPEVEEFKTYCPGVGVVLEEEEGTRVELVESAGL